MKHVDINRELQALEQRDGVLMPDRVVEFASDPKSALHSQFEWDDGEAAHQWRLEQARSLIRVVVRMVGDSDPTPRRAYVSLKRDRVKSGGYRTLVSVLEDPELRAEMLEQARDEAKSWSVRYRELQELAKIHDAVAELTTQ